jgi:hypothetical protein
VSAVAAKNRDLHVEAHRGAQDFQAVAGALQALAQKLGAAWDIRIGQSSSEAVPVSADAMNSLFQHAYRRAGESFVKREQQRGKVLNNVDEYIHSSDDNESIVRRRNYIKLKAWNSIKGKLLEAMCLLTTLSHYEPGQAGMSINILARLGPVSLRDGDQIVFLWTRPLLLVKKTGLKACPDLVLTKDQEVPTKANMLWIVECKYRTALNAQELRAESGKARELEAPSYTIVSYYRVSDRLQRGGQGPGVGSRSLPAQFGPT